MVAASTGPVVGARTGTYDPVTDVDSVYSTAQYAGVAAWWRSGFTGKGIDVAVIDSGLAHVSGLDDRDKVIYRLDLSLESQAPNLTNLDGFGKRATPGRVTRGPAPLGTSRTRE